MRNNHFEECILCQVKENKKQTNNLIEQNQKYGELNSKHSTKVKR